MLFSLFLGQRIDRGGPDLRHVVAALEAHYTLYDDAKDEVFDETQQFTPANPYSASKAAADMYAWAYAQSFDIPALVVLSKNAYSRCQHP